MSDKDRIVDGKKYRTCATCGELFWCFWHNQMMIGRPVWAGLCKECGDKQEREDRERFACQDAKRVN